MPATSPGCRGGRRTSSRLTSALRTAGLAQSRRDGEMVRYALTPPGRRLVQAVLGERVAAP